MSNPVDDVSVQTIIRAAKEVLRNGRKALACVKEAEGDYKDGTLPSGRTISDYHRYVRERMFVKLKGTIGADCDDADATPMTMLSDQTMLRKTTKTAINPSILMRCLKITISLA
jgi:hypothetical protein